MLRRLWQNAEWELRFPLYIGHTDNFQAIMAPSRLRIVQRALQLLLKKVRSEHAPRYAVLTFDDGPYTGSTETLLQVLAEEQVPATFFLVGQDARANAASTQAIVAAGMEIASHSKSHRRLTEIDQSDQFDEIAVGRSLVEEASGTSIRYFRPPHGAFDMVTLEKARETQQTLALWNVNPADYDEVDANEIVARVVDQQRNPAVILLHTGRPETIAAIPEIVKRYKALGFTFTTTGQLEAAMRQ